MTESLVKKSVLIISQHRSNGRHKECLDNIENVLKLLDLDLTTTDIYPSVVKHEIQEPDIYNLIIELYYNATISLYYLNRKDEGLRISDRILFSNCKSYNVANNIQHYVTPHPRINDIKVPFTPPNIEYTETPYYKLNPSIIPYKEGYLINCRCVNFENYKCQTYKPIGLDYIITRNFLVLTDKYLKPIGSTELIDASDLPMIRPSVRGMEDCQLFWMDSKVQLLTSLYYISRDKVICCWGQLPDKLLGHLDILAKTHSHDGKKDEAKKLEDHYDLKILRPIYKPGFTASCEKNWLPWVETIETKEEIKETKEETKEETIETDETKEEDKKQRLRFIYTTNPVKIIEPKCDTPKDLKPWESDPIRLLIEKPSIPSPSMRGSGGPIPFKLPFKGIDYVPGYLIMIHEVVYLNPGRIYYHRWLWYDSSFDLQMISCPFILKHIGVEYVRSICKSHHDTILIGYGYNDKEAYIMEVSIESIIHKLHSIEKY